MNTFDFIKDILTEKKYLFDETTEVDYNPFIINRGLSYHRDSLFWANEMNKPGIPKKMQHDFLFNTIRGSRRPYIKWESKGGDENLMVVMKYFKVSPQKAKEILMILDDHEIKQIKEILSEGGVNGRSK